MSKYWLLSIFIFCVLLRQITGQEIDTKDCDKDCGIGGRCRKASDESKLKCLSCAKGRKLRNGRCLYLGRLGPWSPCSVTCGPGKRTRTPSCKPDITRKNLCYPTKPKTEECTMDKCPDPFQAWGQWGLCKQTSGICAQFRYRACKEKSNCDEAGRVVDMRACKQPDCTSEVTGWSDWSTCSTTCGAGIQKRHRHCLTKETAPCKQDLTESRNCPENPPCDCGWCPWVVKESRFTKECLEEEKIRYREPSCPAFQPPGKNCNGTTNDVQRLAEAPGRQKQIKDAKRLTFRFKRGRRGKRNPLFKFSCKGGCIKITSVSVFCKEWYQLKKLVIDVCGGKSQCEFKPDGKFFRVEQLNCRTPQATIKLKCVGGEAIGNHTF